MPLKIGLLVIATNKYIKFAQPLYDSVKRHFMVGHDVTMFVFTDMPDVPVGTTRIEQAHAPWPAMTLTRYNIFSRHEGQLSQMDYLFYCDADMRFEGPVGDEILGDLVVTRHPGFWDKPYSVFSQSYEKRPQSMAYMPPGRGTAYYAGGFNGGRSAKYLAMAREIAGWVDEDTKKGIVAAWHDESHLQRYVLDHPPTVVLDPSYCFPESWNLPFQRKLLALDKNHEEVRS